jgi:FkbH-like protein
MAEREIRVAVLAASNLDLLASPLRQEIMEKRLAASVWSAGFNQYRQAVIDPASRLYADEADAVILFLDALDLFGELLEDPLTATPEAGHEAAERMAGEVEALVGTMASRLPRATVYLNTAVLDGVGSLYGLEYNSPHSLRAVVSGYNAALGSLAQENPSVIVVDVESLAANIGLERWFDRRLWHLGRIRYSREAIGVLARTYAAAIAARYGLTRKCLVLDLDNTLWGGLIGEDGTEGIQLGHEGVGLAFVEFQRELRSLSRRGILLALCSKNDPKDALSAIRDHPAMILNEEDFAAQRINWADKAENLCEIAKELNIGLDSLVFLDDNPVERARVRAALPAVAVPEWPQDPSEYRNALLRVVREEFLRFHVTDEDRGRAEMYRAQSQRRPIATAAGGDLESFYRSLEMKVTIGRADARTIPRIAQLTQKTNQFNLTTRRYTQAEIARFAEHPGMRVYWLDLADRFGPNGIVGVIILSETRAGRWAINTFLMSCRIIGLTVEQAFMNFVAAELAADGAVALTGEYLPTAKNAIVADLYDRLGFVRQHGQQWALDLAQAPTAIPHWFELHAISTPVPVVE